MASRDCREGRNLDISSYLYIEKHQIYDNQWIQHVMQVCRKHRHIFTEFFRFYGGTPRGELVYCGSTYLIFTIFFKDEESFDRFTYNVPEIKINFMRLFHQNIDLYLIDRSGIRLESYLDLIVYDEQLSKIKISYIDERKTSKLTGNFSDDKISRSNSAPTKMDEVLTQECDIKDKAQVSSSDGVPSFKTEDTQISSDGTEACRESTSDGKVASETKAPCDQQQDKKGESRELLKLLQTGDKKAMIDALSNTFTKEQLEVLRTSLTEAQEKQNEEPGSIEDTHVKPDEKMTEQNPSDNEDKGGSLKNNPDECSDKSSSSTFEKDDSEKHAENQTEQSGTSPQPNQNVSLGVEKGTDMQTNKATYKIHEAKFYLYTAKKLQIEEAHIHFNHVSNYNNIPLKETNDRHVWESTKITLHLKENASYTYSAKSQKDRFYRWSRPTHKTNQRFFRSQERGCYYDTLCDPVSQTQAEENEGKLFFLRERVKHEDHIKEMLEFCDSIHLFESVSSLTIKEVEQIINSLHTYSLTSTKVQCLLTLVSKMVEKVKKDRKDYDYKTSLTTSFIQCCVDRLKTQGDAEHFIIKDIAKIASHLSIKLHGTTSTNLIDIVDDFFPFIPHSLLKRFEGCSTEVKKLFRLTQLFKELDSSTHPDAILNGKMIIEKLRKVGDIQYLRKHMGNSKFSCDVKERLVQVLSEQIRSENELKGIRSLLTSYGEHVVESTTLAELVRHKTYKTLKESKSIDRGDFLAVVKHPGLFHANQIRVYVMLTILQRQEPSSCDIVRHLLINQQWINLPENDMKKVCTDWLKNKTNVLKSDKLNDIECMYAALEDILTTKCLTGKRGITEYLSSRVLEHTQTHSTENLIEVLRNGDHLTETFFDHFRQILAERISSTNDSVSLLKLIVDKPFKNERSKNKVIEMILDEVKFANSEESVAAILLNSEMWSDLIEKSDITHQTVDKLKEIVDKLFADLKNYTISYRYSISLSKMIDNSETSTTKLFSQITGVDETNIMKVLRNITYLHQETKEIFNNLDTVLNQVLKPLSSYIQNEDLDESKILLSNIGSNLSKGDVHLSQVKDGSCFKQMSGIIQISNHISTLADSNIFKRECQYIVEDALQRQSSSAIGRHNVHINDSEIDTLDLNYMFGDYDIPPNENPDDGKLSVLDVVKVIGEEAINRFREVTHPLICGNNLPFEHLMKLFNDCDADKERVVIGGLHKKQFPAETLLSIHNVARFHDYESRAKEMELLASVFNTSPIKSDPSSDLAQGNEILHCLQQLRDQRESEVTMFEINNIFDKIEKITKNISDAEWELVGELSQCKYLIDFVRLKIDQDFRNLIDAVEEHSEQSLGEEEVNAFIEVKAFLHPFLKSSNNTLEQMFNTLRRQQKYSVKEMKIKFSQCRKNFERLKALVNSVGNREELTHEVIQNSLSYGKLRFELNANGFSDIMLQYKKNKRAVTKSSDEIVDLRSRALLLGNYSRAKDAISNKTTAKPMCLNEFVNCVDMAMNIKDIFQNLHDAGHFSYHTFTTKCNLKDTDKLHQMQNDLSHELLVWNESLQKARNQYFFLNFIHGYKIREVYAYFKILSESTSRNSELQNHYMNDVEHFVKPFKVNNSFNNEIIKTEKSLECVDMIGYLLDQYFSKSECSSQHMPSLNELPGYGLHSNVKRQLDATVKHGELYVAHLDENSNQTLPVIMDLYANTTQTFPAASTLLFCNDETTEEDLNLLIMRCEQSDDYKLLFCIANVEKLDSILMFKLIDSIRNLTKSGRNFLLAIIYCGKPCSPVVEQFADCVHKIYGMNTETLSEILNALSLDVVVFTSTLQGQGKTERMYQRAAASSKSVKTLTTEGRVVKASLIHALRGLNLKKYHVLHLNIAQVENCNDLDCILFEIIVLGSVKSNDDIYYIPVKSVAIEIANTTQDNLLRSLMMPKFLKRENISWENYADVIVSQEPCSCFQVVCLYLHYMDCGLLDTEDIEDLETKQCLSSDECIRLLQKYVNLPLMSYTILNTFMSVLVEQLKRLTKSVYFSINNIADMIGHGKGIKSTLVKSLIDVSLDFARRAVDVTQANDQNITAKSLVDRFENMIHWTDENHLFFVFHTYEQQTLSPVYRLLEKVPDNIKELFNEQMCKPLADFQSLSQMDLHKMLENIVRHKTPRSEEDVKGMLKNYSLTPDNFLKMILMNLRISASIPVVIMGETGCGKTRLITYLAETCGVELLVKNIHAGTTDIDIIGFFHKVNEKALGDLQNDLWVFFDEINTCDHLGLLSELVCQGTLKGKVLLPNVKLLAACNPYKFRKQDEIRTAGLEQKVKSDMLSRLVYRVHPLPENLIDYVWDFGSLELNDEAKYIHSMVNGLFKHEDNNLLLADMLVKAQNHFRAIRGNAWCVSLRDVKRCIILTDWFNDYFLQLVENHGHFALQFPKPHTAIILSLFHCYVSRLEKACDREKYWKVVSETFMNHEIDIHHSTIMEVPKRIQMKLLDFMELPAGTAKNSALLENVFVMFVCIVKKLPIFVVGKPGCSKSLSMQLLRDNMHGKQSVHQFFQDFPQLYVVSFQGSESSTSEGIEKVFEKASNYQKLSKDDNILAMVLLDEIGLAANSRFNPLKVLHSLLEPNESGTNIAVVGISNWALDGAKMNRAIHLSRPDLNEQELYETGLSIIGEQSNDIIKAVAKAYFKYQKCQNYTNFHGLRDFYSLVKFIYLTKKKEFDSSDDLLTSDDMIIKRVHIGLLRNFGGIESEMDHILDIFMRALDRSYTFDTVNIESLVTDNVADKMARHLLLVTNGDSGINLVSRLLDKMKRPSEIMIGSHFREDQSDEYTYRMLSRVILCMEQGIVLVMKGLDSVYGSLYDMLNQNYTIMDGRKNCRIAIGPYHCPMCHVHDDFRCIVLVETNEIATTDPPFLNRFEKQKLHFSNILSSDQKEIVKSIDEWVSGVCKTDGFQIDDMLVGYFEDTVPSLVLKQIQSDCPQDIKLANIEKCKVALIGLASPDGVLRMSNSQHSKGIIDLQKQYFSQPTHQGLSHFVQTRLNQEPESGASVGLKLTVFTHSSIFTDLASEMSTLPSAVCCKLTSFQSENHIQTWVENFFTSDEHEILILQCIFVEDSPHIQLVKYIVERQSVRSHKYDKHVIITLHVDRNEVNAERSLCLDFLNGWEMVMIDPLCSPVCNISSLLGKDMVDVLLSDAFPIKSIIENGLLKTFTYIQCTSKSRDLRGILELIKDIKEETKEGRLIDLLVDKVVQCLKMKSFSKIDRNAFHADNWQVKVASNSTLINRSESVVDAMLKYMTEEVHSVLATLVFKLEDYSAWSSYFVESQSNLWRQVFMEKIDVSSELPPSGPECYVLHTSPLETRFPFSVLYIHGLNKVKSLYPTDTITQEDIMKGTADLIPLVQQKMLDLERSLFPNLDKFIHDFCIWQIRDYDVPLVDNEKKELVIWLLEKKGLPTTHSVSEADTFQYIARLFVQFWYYESEIISVLELVQSIMDISLGCFDKIWQTYVATKTVEIHHETNDDDGDDDDDETAETEFEDQLIDTMCLLLLPTENVLCSCGGYEQWCNRISVIINRAMNVTSRPASIHFLKFCYQMALFSEENNGILNILTDLSNFVYENGSDSIESDEMCSRIHSHVTELEGDIKEKIPDILCAFFECCLKANLDTPVIDFLLKCITDGTIHEDSAKTASFAMHCIIKEECDAECGTASVSDILQNDAYPEQFLRLDTYLKEGNVLAPLLSSVIEQQHLSIIDVDMIKQIDHADCELLQLARKTAERVKCSNDITIGYLFSVDFIKTFLSSLAKLIGSDSFPTPEKDRLLELIKPIFRPIHHLEEHKNRVYALVVFVLKEICKYHGIRACIEIQRYPVFSEILEIDGSDIIFPNGYLIMAYGHKDYDIEHEKNMSDFTEMLENIEERFRFVAAMFDRFLLTICKRPLSTKEKDICEKILDSLPEENLLTRLLSFLTGIRTSIYFPLEALHERDEIYVQKMIVCFHFSSVIISSKCCKDIPSYINKMNMTRSPNSNRLITHVAICVCGNRLMEKSQLETQCCLCKRNLPTSEMELISIAQQQNEDIIVAIISLFINGIKMVLHEITQGFETCSLDKISVLIENDWQKIQTYLHLTGRQLSDLLHFVITQYAKNLETTNVDEVQDVDVLKAIISEAIANKNRSIKLIQRECCTFDENSIQHVLFETFELGDDDKSISRILYRRPEIVCFEHMEIDFYQCNARLPLLELFFSCHKDLVIVKHGVAIIQWHKEIKSKLDRHITRMDAESLTIHNAIFRRDSTEREEIQDENLLSAFNNLLNSIRILNDYGQQNSKPALTPKLTQDSRLIDSLLTSTESPLYSLLCSLACVQNDFLDHCLSIALNVGNTSVDFLKTSESASCVRTTSVDNIKTGHVIDYQEIDDVDWYVQNDSMIQSGEGVHFDFQRFDIHIAETIVRHKRYIVCDDTSFFHFARELFHSTSNVLKEVSTQTAQDHRLPEDIHRGLQALRAESLQKIETLQSNIEIAICLLKRTGAKPEDRLSHYMDTWMASKTDQIPSHILPQPREKIHMRHLVSLYESIESHISERSVKTLGTPFKRPLKFNLKGPLCLKLKKEKPVLLSILHTSLKRFIHRFLSAPGNAMHLLDTSLSELLTSANLWIHLPPDCDNPQNRNIDDFVKSCVEDVIPPEISLENIYAVYEIANNTLQEHLKGETQSRRPQTGPKPRRQPKKSHMNK